MDKFPVDVIAHLNHRALVDVKTVCEKRKRGAFTSNSTKSISMRLKGMQKI